MKKIIILFILSLTLTDYTFSQEEDFFSGEEKEEQRNNKSRLERWSIGGNFWLSFGTNSYVEVSPVFLYRATPKLLVGPGVTYIYRKDSFWGIETSYYGPRAIATYTLFSNLDETLNLNIGNIILHTEFESLNTEKWDYDSSIGRYVSNGRTWINSYLLGGGLFQPLGQRGGISIIVLYNFLETDYTPYSNPVVRIGFYF